MDRRALVAILDATVTIAGVDYTGDTLGNLRVRRGREDINTEPQAGYCLVQLIDDTGAGFPVEVTDTVVVTIENSTGTIDLFTGTISDWSSSLYQVRTGARAVWEIIASGPLALANRRQVLASGAASQNDGDLVLEVLDAALRQTWDDYRGSTWTAAVGTWETVDPGYDSTLVETPGEYTLAALPAADAGYNANGLLSQIASSVGGYVFETGSGNVGYLSAYGRSVLASAGYTSIANGAIRADSLLVSQSAADLVNRIEVTYDGGSVELEDVTSIGRYGLRTSVLQTVLANLSAAEDVAEDLLFDLATPRSRLPQVQFELHTLEDADVDTLLGIDLNSPVDLGTLPTTLGGGARLGFIEGLQYDLGSARRRLTVYVSDAQLSLRSERWEDVNVTYDWTDVSATLEWADARRITT